MSNQFSLDVIPEADRAEIVRLYKSKIGYGGIVKRTAYGHDVVKRVLREERIPTMKVGNQVIHPVTETGTKICTICLTELPVDKFGSYDNHNGAGRKLRGYCNGCAWKRDRNTTIKRQYGITIEEYEKLLTDQKGLCAVCGQPETHKGRGKENVRHFLSLDHCHKTGKIRQLLCHRCNMALGHIGENPELCDRLKAYILSHN